MTPVSHLIVEGRLKLPKLKIFGENERKADRILKKYLQNFEEITDIVNAVYAMGLAVCDIMGVKKKQTKQNQSKGKKKNRR